MIETEDVTAKAKGAEEAGFRALKMRAHHDGVDCPAVMVSINLHSETPVEEQIADAKADVERQAVIYARNAKAFEALGKTI